MKKTLSIFRYKKPGKRGIMPVSKVIFYNKIDIGIFLFFLETCLNKEDINKLIDIEPDGWLKVFFTNNHCRFE